MHDRPRLLAPFLLQAAMFCGEIAVGLGMTGRAFVVAAEDVVGEEELRVAATAGAERHEDQPSLFFAAPWGPITASPPSDFGAERTNIDLDASGPLKFYHVEITKP